MRADILRNEAAYIASERLAQVAATPLAGVDIMLDLDDVFFPWADSIHAACGLAGLHDGKAPWRSWRMWEDYGCSKEAWLDVVTKATIDGLYHQTPPYPGSVEAARRLFWEGATLHVVTARGFMAHGGEIRDWTDEWLEEHAFPFHTRTFAKDKAEAMTRVLQHESLRRIGLPEVFIKNFDYALDDGVHNYEALDNAGVQVYLLNRPHNQDFDAERRVDSVDEFVDIIFKERS